MQRIEVGLSMLYCIGHPFSYMAEHLRKAEVRHIEVLDEAHHALNKRRIKIIKDISQSRGFNLSVHAPFVDVNLASPNSSFRRVILRRLKKSIGFASQLDAALWIFHSGLRTGVSSYYPGEDWKINLQAIRELLDTANNSDMKITIENTPDPFPFILKSVDEFFRFYEDLGDAELGLTLDVGHANVNGQIYDFIKRFSDRIVHVHASDNDGTFDQHRGIGEGNIDWASVAEALRNIRYGGVVVVESDKRADESVQTLRAIFH